MTVCPNCGGATMMPEGKGFACQDPDCLQHLVVVYPEPLTIPIIFDTSEPNDDENHHGG